MDMDQIVKMNVRSHDRMKWMKRATELIEANERYANSLRAEYETEDESDLSPGWHKEIAKTLAYEMRKHYLAEFQKYESKAFVQIVADIECMLIGYDYRKEADYIADEAQMEIQMIAKKEREAEREQKVQADAARLIASLATKPVPKMAVAIWERE